MIPAHLEIVQRNIQNFNHPLSSQIFAVILARKSVEAVVADRIPLAALYLGSGLELSAKRCKPLLATECVTPQTRALHAIESALFTWS